MTETLTETTDAGWHADWRKAGYEAGYEWKGFGLAECTDVLILRTSDDPSESYTIGEPGPYARGWFAGIAAAMAELVGEASGY